MQFNDFLPNFAKSEPDPEKAEEKLKARFRAMARGPRKKKDGN